ncbi:hypothetical protein Scep_013992 [Stephania cephalantha]|uniref:Uncharacterized protein n=1 Tax=Stephania cephalantha TaxID=152367 RepID=A0AAP0J2Y7_9MAGN
MAMAVSRRRRRLPMSGRAAANGWRRRSRERGQWRDRTLSKRRSSLKKLRGQDRPGKPSTDRRVEARSTAVTPQPAVGSKRTAATGQ